MYRPKPTIAVLLALLAAVIVWLLAAPSYFDSGEGLQAASRAAGDETEPVPGPEVGESSDLVAVAPSGGARHEVPAPLAAPAPQPTGPARLTIVLRGGGEPYPGCIVRFDPRSGAAVDIPGREGRIGVTDQDGKVTFRVPPDATLAVEVIPFGTDAVERWSVAAPGLGETREFLILLPPRSVALVHEYQLLGALRAPSERFSELSSILSA